jgi:hypothetical protein
VRGEEKRADYGKKEQRENPQGENENVEVEQSHLDPPDGGWRVGSRR